MKTIVLNCATCKISFFKEEREHRRQIKNGRVKFFCSQSCSTKMSNKENPRKGNIKNIIPNNLRDEFTPFRHFIIKSKNRDKLKNRETKLTVELLKILWEKQNGICPITSWKLILPESSKGFKTYLPSNASIDRLDNSLGYTIDNVRFVAVIANLARNLFTDEQLINFCKAVATNKS